MWPTRLHPASSGWPPKGNIGIRNIRFDMLRARRLVALWQQRPAAARVATASMRADYPAVLRAQQWASPSASRVFSTDVAARQGAVAAPTADDHTVAELATSLAACRENGDWRKALKMLDALDQRGRVDAVMYEHAVAACARMGKVDVLPGLLQNMAVDGLRPTAASVDFVVQAHLAREEWRELADHIASAATQGVALSPAAFQAGMEACGQLRDAATVMTIVDAVREAGELQLTDVHYAGAIRAVGMSGRADMAVTLFNALDQSAAASADAQVTPEVLNQLIRAQIVNQALRQALQTFAMAERRELAEQLPESIYTATIDALVKRAQNWQAAQLFERMLALQLRPTTFCLGRAVVAYVHTNKPELARACWTQMEAAAVREPLGPAIFKYTKLLNELAASRDTDLALRVFEFLADHFPPEQLRPSTFAVAIRSFGREGRTQEAMDLFDAFVASCRKVNRALPRHASVYVAAFNALSRDTTRDPKHNTRDAKRVWDLMVANVPEVLPPAYASLAGVFASSGELDALEDVLAQASASLHIPVDGRIEEEDEVDEYDEVDEVDDDDEVDEDEEVLASMDMSDMGQSKQQDELLLNGVISGFAKAREDQSEHIVAYLALMRARGLTINDSIVRAATEAFVRHKQWTLATKLSDFVDVSALRNADLCFGNTISKLLDAKAYAPARHWITLAHKLGVTPPFRNKMAVLSALQADTTSPGEWRIAYVLALETLGFKQLGPKHVESVADAVDVCARSARPDLVVKLYHALSEHRDRSVIVPLRVFKHAALALLRDAQSGSCSSQQEYENRVRAAERVGAAMLGTHGRDLDGEALSLAISLRATLGDDDDVMALYETMPQLGLEPNSFADNAAVTAYSRAGKAEQVLAIWRSYADSETKRAEIDHNVLRALLRSLALARQDDALAATVRDFPTCSADLAVQALLQAGRPDKAVEMVETGIARDTFKLLLNRVMSNGAKTKAPAVPVDPLLGAALILRATRVGATVLLPGDVLRVVKRLLSAERMVEAEQLLALDAVNDSALNPAQQREAMEARMFIYGEMGAFSKLRELLDREGTQPSALPLRVAHYEAAMEYGVESRDALVGPVAALQLFEALRKQFLKPSGAVYVLALRACLKLDRLETTGTLLVQDCVEQGFAHAVTGELAKRALDPDSDAQELAQVALLCQSHGVELPIKVLNALGNKRRKELAKNTGNELAYLLEQHRRAPTRARSTSRGAVAADEGQPGTKWGDLYLQPLGRGDDDK